jgi:hypothetical protein
MLVFGPLAADGKERACASVRDGPGQRTAFVEHVTQAPCGRAEYSRTLGLERVSRVELTVP